MPTKVKLFKWTEQGVKEAKNEKGRKKETKTKGESMGAKTLGL